MQVALCGMALQCTHWLVEKPECYTLHVSISQQSPSLKHTYKYAFYVHSNRIKKVGNKKFKKVRNKDIINMSPSSFA